MSNKMPKLMWILGSIMLVVGFFKSNFGEGNPVLWFTIFFVGFLVFMVSILTKNIGK